MNLTTIIDLTASTLGLISGGFFCIGVLRLKDSTIESIATIFYGPGKIIATELVLQKIDFIFGSIFLVASFAIQVVGKLLPEHLKVIATSANCEASIGLGIPLIALIFLYFPYRIMRKNALKKFESETEGKA